MRPIFNLLGLIGLAAVIAAGAYWFYYRQDYDLSFKSKAEIAAERQKLREQIEDELKAGGGVAFAPSGSLEVSDLILSNDRFLAVDGLLSNRGAESVLDVALLATVTDGAGNLLAAQVGWVRTPLAPAQTERFRIIFQGVTGELQGSVEARVSPLGWKTAATAQAPPPGPPGSRSADEQRDPRLKGKILGY